MKITSGTGYEAGAMRNMSRGELGTFFAEYFINSSSDPG